MSPETFDLVALAVDAWRDTGGRFDPTVLPALLASGYDRDFAEVAASDPADTAGDPVGPAPGAAGIELDRTVGAIRLPPGVALDLGGIGKGRAADLLAAELLAARRERRRSPTSAATSAWSGEPPRAEGWLIEVDDPLGTGATGRLSLRAARWRRARALRRAWSRGGRAYHHLIDPRTGRARRDGAGAVTVVAGSACRAEVLAKAAFVAGPARRCRAARRRRRSPACSCTTTAGSRTFPASTPFRA